MYPHLAVVVFRDEAQCLEQRLLGATGSIDDANVDEPSSESSTRLSESDVISDDASPPDTAQPHAAA
jgi:hypothetical protein